MKIIKISYNNLNIGKIDNNANSIKTHYDNKPFEYKFTSPKEAASTMNETTKNGKSSSNNYTSPR